MSEYSGSSKSLPLNPPTLQVCHCPLSERGTRSNPIVIDDLDPLASPSNSIVINCENFECNTHGPPPWAQGTVECPIKLETDGETCEILSSVNVDESWGFMLQADIEPIEEIDLTYSKLPTSVSKETKVFESKDDIHGLGASSLSLELKNFEEQANTSKTDEETISTAPEEEDQADAGLSIPRADDIDDVSSESKGEADTGTTISEIENDFILTEAESEDQADAGSPSPKGDDNGVISTKSKERGGLGTGSILREAGFVSKEAQEASIKRKMESHCFPSTVIFEIRFTSTLFDFDSPTLL